MDCGSRWTGTALRRRRLLQPPPVLRIRTVALRLFLRLRARARNFRSVLPFFPPLKKTPPRPPPDAVTLSSRDSHLRICLSVYPGLLHAGIAAKATPTPFVFTDASPKTTLRTATRRRGSCDETYPRGDFKSRPTWRLNFDKPSAAARAYFLLDECIYRVNK